jgi:miniconductance mechanosensitive channel
MDKVQDFAAHVENIQMDSEFFHFGIVVLSIAILFLAIYVVVVPLLKRWAQKSPSAFNKILVDQHVASRLLQVVPATAFSAAVQNVLDPTTWLFEVSSRVANIWYTLLTFAIACSILDVIEHFNGINERTMKRPLHGIFQAVKVSLFCLAAIFIVSQVTDKSPVIIFSAIGAMTTVLMLIFKDSILGVVSGVQINLSDLLCKGDWIEIERHHADGTVMDITLTSVKVRNWDNTISVIPAYDLITNSFRNWRGMQESGARRIKRSLFIDVKSIRFLTPEEIDSLSKIEILAPYLDAKAKEIAGEAAKTNELGIAPDLINPEVLNDRHLTNIGTFRAYCTAYLRSRKNVVQDMTLMTRLLEPTPQGIPLEIYAFANTVVWEDFEGIQADILDHLIAALPEFGLELYQYGTAVPIR